MVDGGQAAEIEYDPDIFTYGPEVAARPRVRGRASPGSAFTRQSTSPA